MREIRILCDPAGAIAINDPTGATFQFVLYDTEKKKIIRRYEKYDGFTDFKGELKKLLLERLEAVERDWIKETTTIKIEEMPHKK